MAIQAALDLADEDGMDLVEIAPNAEPPVCRVMDYGKFRFEQAKKAQIAKKKQKNTQLKEVKFRPGTEDHDYQVKMRNVRRFLDEGDKVKLTLRFRGREMAHKELGAAMLKRVETDLGDEIHMITVYTKDFKRKEISHQFKSPSEEIHIILSSK